MMRYLVSCNDMYCISDSSGSCLLEFEVPVGCFCIQSNSKMVIILSNITICLVSFIIMQAEIH